MPFRTALSTLFICLTLGTAQAHEVWIEPLKWEIDTGDVLMAHRINGEDFKGSKLIWNPQSTVLAEKRLGGQITPLEGRTGNKPAFRVPTSDEGLLTLIYQSTHSTITYRDYAKFARFVTSKGWKETLESHSARKLPETPIKEAYVRFAKALVAVGDGAGEDTARGMELELVALDNPYTEVGTELRFQLLYRDAPLAGNKITVFTGDDAGQVSDFNLTTDADGRVSFTPEPGVAYLIDSVLLREPARELVIETKGAVWESLWASLTFRAPDIQ
ncbi:DUF4198 domain-containing protein [Sulfitobacter mediterraneus]|uniref:DUF4198 domain-containing protein n=1 Tax=Sulfitobacter mediterraneus TaxID=83219 RepID=UPI0019321811|nr:DUF4198 domain-containing protein [Sulfitobacter mediterraneus]MBM1635202.1 DUF4198 domain-containing protein [Sulfitobacter mediterraneus]MBM1643053.1 DUF4198 domain-containing protein [Sulfitobacter mediterraneus]MBM1647101.1 DUF4198 domain-containing protein [Sulfitobacter mediterraneus]MBM1651143.1 DUF4198 domain-containing protein [Sulfitobacter mediterraneus]MBM1655130.1 DUF4198 domain-containing protein [Sulfitobacter mediterraneus]